MDDCIGYVSRAQVAVYGEGTSGFLLQRNAMNQNKDENISLHELVRIIGDQMTTKDIRVHRIWLADGGDLCDCLN